MAEVCGSGHRPNLCAVPLTLGPSASLIADKLTAPVGEGRMAIYRILQKSTFSPEEVARMEQAYELALAKLNVLDRNDPITEVIAGHVVAVARTGEESALRICDLALDALRRGQ
jgi:hypothetical protein